MVPSNRVTSILAAISVIIVGGLPFSAINMDQNNLWAQNGSRIGGPPPGQGGDLGGRAGGERGFPNRGPGGGMQTPSGPMPGGGRGSFSPSEVEIDKIMQGLRQRDPNRANELSGLRKINPQLFREQLRSYAGPEYNSVIIDQYRSTRRTEFLEWLKEYVPKVEADMNDLRQRDPVLYAKTYELTWRKYSTTFDLSQTNSDPNWAQVLVLDLELVERQNMLRGQIRDPRNASRRSELIAQLEKVVSDKYDNDISRKKIAYEQALRRLNELRKDAEYYLEDIKRGEDPNEKSRQIPIIVQSLTAPSRRGGGGFPSGGGRGGGGFPPGGDRGGGGGGDRGGR